MGLGLKVVKENGLRGVVTFRSVGEGMIWYASINPRAVIPDWSRNITRLLVNATTTPPLHYTKL